mmetsp:Transcript_2380/g.2795  ORF Transcript_2380/g.2795 Transcript_2380/m.2795 type:complete len:274 (-) Transcript_2380:50-871(-)
MCPQHNNVIIIPSARLSNDVVCRSHDSFGVHGDGGIRSRQQQYLAGGVGDAEAGDFRHVVSRHPVHLGDEAAWQTQAALILPPRDENGLDSICLIRMLSLGPVVAVISHGQIDDGDDPFAPGNCPVFGITAEIADQLDRRCDVERSVATPTETLEVAQHSQLQRSDRNCRWLDFTVQRNLELLDPHMQIRSLNQHSLDVRGGHVVAIDHRARVVIPVHPCNALELLQVLGNSRHLHSIDEHGSRRLAAGCQAGNHPNEDEGHTAQPQQDWNFF